MRIATWNVNSLRVRFEQLKNVIIDYGIDIIALQEIKLSSDLFPEQIFTELGYNSIVNGQKTYNGVALISKFKIFDVVYDIPGFDDTQKRVISATINDIRIINVYCVNGESLISDKFEYKKVWFKKLFEYIKNTLLKYEKVIVLGDFNIAASDIDIYDATKWNNRILSSETERKIYKDILNLGLIDIVREINPHDRIYTWWDYRMNSFKRDLGLRIDYILVSKLLFPIVKSYYVAKEIRSIDKPSDHAPFWIDIN